MQISSSTRPGFARWIGALAALFLLISSVNAADVFPATIQTGEVTLSKQGQGTRKKAFISLYNAALYLPDASTDAASIIQADQPMAIRLNIVSGLISSKKMKKAMNDGFDRSTGNNVAPIKIEIDAFATGFRDEINKKDVFDLVYSPGKGVEVLKNGSRKVTVQGLPFKQALFGIWLSQDPIQGSLKKALLGAN